ncbi:internalin_A [Hexamita inflata]|uniref:Internalin A n=1 Tax=Hexamita inflata TaxID=28002 RepID=A0AA86V1Q4_9EUKA|nr:internalin A [Hexamita inflata]
MLEVLQFINFNQQESKTLTQEIVRFQKLKELHLEGWKINISPLSQMINITSLVLNRCELRSTEALKLLINLKELHLNLNKGVEITSLQYLTKLTKLSLQSCNLVNIDALRPLSILQELYINDNKIVFIQPIVGLKLLFKLDAGYNCIKDSDLIKHHQNINQYQIDSYEPTYEQLLIANTMKDIQNQITNLRNIYKLANYLQQQNIIFRSKISEGLRIQYSRQVSFIAQAAYLFKQMNHIEGQQ